MDFHLAVGRDADPLFLTWLRWVPPGMTARQLDVAEKVFLRAAREAGATTGLYELPGSDELATRRARR